MDKFIIKPTPTSQENENEANVNNVDDSNVVDVNVDNIDVNDNLDANGDDNLDDSDYDNLDNNDNVNLDDNANGNDFHTFDIFDPRNWDSLDYNMKNTLALKGPKRDLSIIKGPKDKNKRRFSSVYFFRTLSNGGKV